MEKLTGNTTFACNLIQDHTQTTYVASGRFEFTVNGEKQVVEAGDGIYIEPDAEHGCTCLEAGTLIDCFSPMRESFLSF